MANRCALTNQIETLSGNISAATYFDANWNNPVTALNDASLGYVNGIAIDSGSANNYIVTCPFGSPTAYNPGMVVAFLPANTSTGASTLTVSPLVSAAIVDFAGNALAPGVIQAGVIAFCVYISGNFRLLYSVQPGILYINQANTASGSTTLTLNLAGYVNVNIVIDCQGGSGSSTTVLLVQNVMKGAHIDLLWYPQGTGQTLKFSNACTDQFGNTITAINSLYASAAGGAVNLISAGWNGIANETFFTGAYFFDAFGTLNHTIRFIGGWV